MRRDDEPPANEDFLFHLSRGSEMLLSNRVVEAKEELERALEHRPRDAQSQDLLAGVYFRLGMYPTAIRIWQGLADEFPEDSVLHVNLGLALFKTGQPAESSEALLRALEIDPDHERAWGYLGLVRWRLGKLDLAREAFLSGGQLTMARRMEEQSSAGDVRAPDTEPSREAATEAPLELPLGIEDAEVRAMRDAASAAADKLADDAHLSLETERPRKMPSGQWNVVETGAISLPAISVAGRPGRAPSPRSVESVARDWALELPEDSPMAIGPAGELLINTKGPVHARLGGLRAVRGPLETTGLSRRFRGRQSHEPLGGEDDPILCWSAPVAAVMSPAEGWCFVALRVDEMHLFVREEFVHAFDDRVLHESGRLPLAGRPSVLISFHGSGVVVLRLPRFPSGLEVRSGEEVFVDPEALVGWTGRLFPSESVNPHTASVPLAFKGQGILLIT